MKITKLNIFILLLRVISILALIVGLILIPFLPTENYWVVPGVMLIFSFLTFTLLRSIILDSISIKMSNDSINISRLFGYNRRVIKNNEILGYSDSEIEIGSARIKVKTLILYTKENEAFELIKYNYWNFGEVKIKLKKYTFLGFEPYNTGLYYRKYKFKNKPNKI